MIKNNKALSMIESLEYIKSSKDEGKEIKGFIKKFSNIKIEDAKELRKKIEELRILKLDDRSISKIIDALPENQEELNKIFVGISLDSEESEKIFGLVREFK